MAARVYSIANGSPDDLKLGHLSFNSPPSSVAEIGLDSSQTVRRHFSDSIIVTVKLIIGAANTVIDSV